ncbi:MAG: DUF4080 domain-containing protein, partial [Bdellovibrionales bacterium]|nr:DUF4080 domain-containing protein [Bdellovibrionales bacterium]
MQESTELILLCALNSTYQHTAFGLRYLKANLEDLSDQCQIYEFTISQNSKDIVEKILSLKPRILGFGVYIWNTHEVLEIIKLIKKIDPSISIVLGGPEISYETEKQEHIYYSDYIIKGEADLSFYKLCKELLAKTIASQSVFSSEKSTLAQIISPEIPAITEIKLPYELYTTEDISNRVIYVEASRGCPYKCEYCLSSLDKSVRNFDLNTFLAAMESLMNQGAREYKFVDRTFNLSPSISQSILNFFLQHIDKNIFLHFEMVPDRLPDELKDLIQKFPSGVLQFEVGIQTLDETVSKNVSRRQNVSKIKENFEFLKTKTFVHTHADLIVGLPGESLNSFQKGFNDLVFMGPDEIQVGILKRLRGTPIVRHDLSYSMVYSDKAPYEIIQNKDLSFFEVQKMTRFSKHWDMIANSGNWKHFINKLQDFNDDKDIFTKFSYLSDFLLSRHANLYGISLLNLAESLWIYMTENLHWETIDSLKILIQDYCFNKYRDLPAFLKKQDPIRSLSLQVYDELKQDNFNKSHFNS